MKETLPMPLRAIDKLEAFTNQDTDAASLIYLGPSKRENTGVILVLKWSLETISNFEIITRTQARKLTGGKL